MMRYWIHLAFLVLAGYFLSMWFPWWCAIILAAVSAYLLRTRFWMSGMFGFLAGFILWAGLALYLDVENHHILSNRIGGLFGNINGLALVAITGFLGGLLISFGSMFGSSLRPKLADK